MKRLKHSIRNIPILGPVLANLYVWLADRRFSGSAEYWDSRYRRGGNSGDGSYGDLARFKATVLNKTISECGIESVIEFGCGDGNQLTLAKYPEYLGLDISPQAVAICQEKFGSDSSKSFDLMENYRGEIADAAMSLDVLFHLVEDDVFDRYMSMLFSAGNKIVVIYASNTDEQESPQPPHVRHRRFSTWVEQHARDWTLARVIENEIPYDPATGTGSPASFHIYVPASA